MRSINRAIGPFKGNRRWGNGTLQGIYGGYSIINVGPICLILYVFYQIACGITATGPGSMAGKSFVGGSFSDALALFRKRVSP